MAAADKAGFALIFNRPTDFVAACETVDIGSMLGQSREKMREVL